MQVEILQTLFSLSIPPLEEHVDMALSVMSNGKCHHREEMTSGAKVTTKYPRNASPLRISLLARKQELARDAIWDAAVDLFAENGFDDTTVDQIADRAGTSRRSFFRHFESKSDLMARPIVLWCDALVQAIERCPPTSSSGELLRKIVFMVLEGSPSSPRVRKLMQIAAIYPAAREAQLSRVASVQARIFQAFFDRLKDKTKAHVLAGLTFTLLVTTYRSWFEYGDEDIITSATRVFAIFNEASYVP